MFGLQPALGLRAANPVVEKFSRLYVKDIHLLILGQAQAWLARSGGQGLSRCSPGQGCWQGPFSRCPSCLAKCWWVPFLFYFKRWTSLFRRVWRALSSSSSWHSTVAISWRSHTLSPRFCSCSPGHAHQRIWSLEVRSSRRHPRALLTDWKRALFSLSESGLLCSELCLLRG